MERNWGLFAFKVISWERREEGEERRGEGEERRGEEREGEKSEGKGRGG